MNKTIFYLFLFSILLLGSACDPQNVPNDLKPYLSGLGRPLDISGPTSSDSTDRNAVIDAALQQTPGRLDLRLPNYGYFQGLVQVENHLVMAGQVRVVGGVLGGVSGIGTGASAFYAGAMVTANPMAYKEAGEALTGGAAGLKTRIRKWEEIPNP